MNRPVLDRVVRSRIAALPLEQRQKAAESLGYADGLPLTEEDIRMNIVRMRNMGLSRDKAMRTLAGPDDVADRRIGALSPAEVGALFGELWPVS